MHTWGIVEITQSQPLCGAEWYLLSTTRFGGVLHEFRQRLPSRIWQLVGRNSPPFWGPIGSTPGGSDAVDAIYDASGHLHGYQCIQFNHPFVQAAFMFIGEIMCGVVYMILRCTGRGEPMPYFNPLYLAVAGMCDMTATSMMYVGLTMTYVSTFQVSARLPVCCASRPSL